ncbi:MAG TPA: cupin domain-containing protein [Flavitalea sp.]|nr:cupin domain-containing protein [Flavitalea sp.]
MKHFISVDIFELKEQIQGAFAAFMQTENLTVAYTDMKAGAEIPLHNHVEEALDIILEGELEMQIGDNTGVLRRGMFSSVPSDIPHKARALTDCKVITVFNPKRRF